MGKAQKAVNTVWGVMRRAKVTSLKSRLTLMDSLVKAGAMYGVEIWGWRRREEIERLQGKFVKMTMGMSRNTPNYIWKLEAGSKSMEVEMRRANKYILEVCEMKEGRWPKIRLKEELRGISNGQPSQWGAKFKEAIEEVGSGTVMDLMYDFIRGKGNNETIKRLLEEENERKMEQDTQRDWVKVDKSTYCGFYKEIKKGVEIEKY